MRQYFARAAAFKVAHPVCEICGSRATNDVHHREGRGKNTLREETWMALCRYCHDWIHNNPGAARAKGWLK